MNQLILNHMTGYVLIGSAAVVASVLMAVHRGLKVTGWPQRDRRKVFWSVAVLLTAWFFAALIPASLGFYGGAQIRTPTIQFGLGIPLVIGLLLFWRWPRLRRVVEAVPQQWLAGIQVFRVLGLIFLLLWAAGRMPGVFALPAGYGDVAVGLLAPVVALAYARKPKIAAGWLLAWNLAGLADLVVALGTGFLSSPSPLQMLAFDRPNGLITAFPLVMIPVFLVPLAILLHLASLKKLTQTEAGPVAGKGATGRNGWMSLGVQNESRPS